MMSDNAKEKRRATKSPDQMRVFTGAVCDKDKSKSKCLRKLFRSVTRNSNPADAEAVQLTLGRDHEWRRHQVLVLKAVSKIIRVMMTKADGTTFYEMDWSQLIELMIDCGLLDVINLLLRVKVPISVTHNDASTTFGDAWESVYFHSLEITSNFIGSDYICHTEQKIKPFFDQIVANRTLLDVVVRHAMDSTRPIQVCHALHILYHISSKHELCSRKIAKKKELFPQLCNYIHKNNSVKMVLDWFKGGIEQFEFDMMCDRPEGMLPVLYAEAFAKSSTEEMTKDEQRHCALTFAYSLHLLSLKLMAVMCIAEEDVRDLVLKDPELLKPCIRWMSAPIKSKFALEALKETLFIVTGLCSHEAICHNLVSEFNLIDLIEKGVFSSSIDLIKGYFNVATKIASHQGMLRNKVGAVESIARSAAIHMYSNSHEIRIYVLTYLTCIVETDGVRHMIKYFGPHHIHYYPEYYFNYAKDLDINVTDLLNEYRLFAASLFKEADNMYRRRLKESPGLNREKAEELKSEGNVSFKNKNYGEAIEKYTEALIMCPPLKKHDRLLAWYDLPIALYSNRAQCHLAVGNYEKAVRDCDKAVARCIGVASPINRFGNPQSNTLLRKAMYRRAKALFEMSNYDHALSDISLCLRGDPSNEILQAFQDKALIHFRQNHGQGPIPSCDKCGLGAGQKLKRCANCTALYCSRECQLSAWDKFHRTNCNEFLI